MAHKNDQKNEKDAKNVNDIAKKDLLRAKKPMTLFYDTEKFSNTKLITDIRHILKDELSEDSPQKKPKS